LGVRLRMFGGYAFGGKQPRRGSKTLRRRGRDFCGGNLYKNQKTSHQLAFPHCVRGLEIFEDPGTKKENHLSGFKSMVIFTGGDPSRERRRDEQLGAGWDKGVTAIWSPWPVTGLMEKPFLDEPPESGGRPISQNTQQQRKGKKEKKGKFKEKEIKTDDWENQKNAAQPSGSGTGKLACPSENQK